MATSGGEPAPALQDLKLRLNALLGTNMLKLVLFGSRARGDHTSTSDIDVAVVVRGLTRDVKMGILHETAEVELDHLTPISLLVLSERQFDHLMRRERLIARDIEHEGIPL